jgi:hypothetical protein
MDQTPCNHALCTAAEGPACLRTEVQAVLTQRPAHQDPLCGPWLSLSGVLSRSESMDMGRLRDWRDTLAGEEWRVRYYRDNYSDEMRERMNALLHRVCGIQSGAAPMPRDGE